MSGSLPFVALRTCGCVFTEAGLKSVIQAVEGERTPPSEGEDGSERTIPCPNCNKPFNTGGEKGKLPWLTLNPRPEVQELMLERLLEERAAAKMAKKEKDGNGKKRKSTNPESDPTLIREEVHYSSKRLKTPIAHATTQSHLSHKVAQQLADLEAKRKEGGMSAAVASIYEGKGQMAGDRKRNAGNDFFTRTYTRVSGMGGVIDAWPRVSSKLITSSVCYAVRLKPLRQVLCSHSLLSSPFNVTVVCCISVFRYLIISLIQTPCVR